MTVHAGNLSVYAGTVRQMLESPCAKNDLMVDSPFMRKLRYILKFVSTLDLVDPEDASFSPRHCRSLHDIIRYFHEKAVQEMFHISDNRLRKLGFAKKLATHIPMQFYVLDVGGGLNGGAESHKEISIQNVRNRAMRALWTGLTHPDIQWGALQHFDWESHDRIIMSGGIASPKATMFTSHAVISDDYMNLNLKFGYHFVIVDALCREDAPANIVQFRFSGGGTDINQRMLRATFLKKVLHRLGFEVSVESDLVDGQRKGAERQTCFDILDMVGRLLGATPLMDMYLKDEGMVESFVDDFNVYYFPIPDECAPDMAAMETAFNWMDSAISRGSKILAHCRFGVGRTGTFVTAYLMQHGLDMKAAAKALKHTRANPTHYCQWKMLRKYKKKLKSEVRG